MVAHFADSEAPGRTLCGRAFPEVRGLVGYAPPCRTCQRVARERARTARIAAKYGGSNLEEG